ncbi:MAG: PEP-CTERM sorting domain-containing protein [Phycisphaerae bacterium]
MPTDRRFVTAAFSVVLAMCGAHAGQQAAGAVVWPGTTTAVPAGPDFESANMVFNGDFNGGTMDGWVQRTNERPREWAAMAGPLGASGIGSTDGSPFATAFAAGRLTATQSIIAQRVDLLSFVPENFGTPVTPPPTEPPPTEPPPVTPPPVNPPPVFQPPSPGERGDLWPRWDRLPDGLFPDGRLPVTPTNPVQSLGVNTPLPATAVWAVEASVDAIYSWDGIDISLEFYDDAGTLLALHTLGNFGPQNGAGVVTTRTESVLLPPTARYVEFVATGRRFDGVWIDSGFDNASLKLQATLVPEPATMSLLATGALLLGRRRR